MEYAADVHLEFTYGNPAADVSEQCVSSRQKIFASVPVVESMYDADSPSEVNAENACHEAIGNDNVSKDHMGGTDLPHDMGLEIDHWC